MLFRTRGDKLPFDMIETNKGVKWLLNYGKSNNDVIIKTNAIILRTLMDSIKLIEEELKKVLDNELPSQVCPSNLSQTETWASQVAEW